MKVISGIVRRYIVATLLVLLCSPALLLGWPTVSRAQDSALEGPRSLVIAYRTSAGNRPAFRRYLIDKMAPRMRSLQKEGKITGFRVYYSWYRQPQVWDAMVVVQFHDFEAVSKWNETERTMPGGLDGQGLALADPVVTVSADLPWSKNPEMLRDGEVYYIIPYEYMNGGEYRDYVRGYVLPQLDGWIREGALSGYEIYMNRYAVGPSWDSLFIQRYRDLKSFGRRQYVLDKVRLTLRDDPVWKGFHERKAKIREETENSIAELIAH